MSTTVYNEMLKAIQHYSLKKISSLPLTYNSYSRKYSIVLLSQAAPPFISFFWILCE